MTRLQVTCSNKRDSYYDAHERITHIGGTTGNGTRWKLTVDEAIKSIEQGTHQFFVSVNGRNADVIVALHNNQKYLKTEPDAYSPNNLLSLPDCL
ncbi:DUF3892 domain-containing protein [Chitinophaga oryzae]|uniref:DUF3892 domain-containing protein n=1 Tax=Chitinophaga oryzae TaxID=2725414 RepID=A0ABX6LN98_9BACT|nr:DUF3892 domain-containing protein [Chitinophaga oryzae]QJB41592.1 DUF3892 domain-containing protein [Chitinophaga oryzae]